MQDASIKLQSRVNKYIFFALFLLFAFMLALFIEDSIRQTGYLPFAILFAWATATSGLLTYYSVVKAPETVQFIGYHMKLAFAFGRLIELPVEDIQSVTIARGLLLPSSYNVKVSCRNSKWYIYRKDVDNLQRLLRSITIANPNCQIDQSLC
jgi:hypothetical protein